MTKKVVQKSLFHKNVKKCVWKDNSQEMGSAGRPKMRAQNAHPPRTPKKPPCFWYQKRIFAKKGGSDFAKLKNANRASKGLN